MCVCVCELANNDCGYFHKVMAPNNVVNYASTDFLGSSLEIAQVLLNCRRGSSCSLASCRLFAEPRPSIYVCVSVCVCCLLNKKRNKKKKKQQKNQRKPLSNDLRLLAGEELNFDPVDASIATVCSKKKGQQQQLEQQQTT